MDRLFIRDLKIETIIGFWEWERRVKQTVSIDLEVGTDARRGAATDSIRSALNYEQIAKRLIELVSASRYQLVESLGEAIARVTITEFGAPWVKVTLTKPGAVEGARDVGIIIERQTADYA